MSNLSSAVKFLSNRFTGVFSRESIEELVSKDKISYEAAAEAISAMPEPLRSSESVVEAVDITAEQKNIISEKALQKYFENVKFEAMLNQIKEDDTLLATEFTNLDNALTRIKAEIVQKYERDYNTILGEIKTTGGVNTEVVDKLIQTKLSVDEIKY